jgi:hypothetical protein
MPKNFEGRGKGSLLDGSFILLPNECGKNQQRVALSANMATSNPAKLVINAAVFCVKKVLTICEGITDRGPNNLLTFAV